MDVRVRTRPIIIGGHGMHGGTSAGAAPPPTPAPTGSYQWSKLKLGGGGLITGVASHYNYNTATSDGTLVCRTDVSGGGAYLYERNVPSGGNAGGLGFWQALHTIFRLPSSFLIANADPRLGSGCYDIQIAPTNSSVIYMASFNNVFVSTTQAASFVAATNGFIGGILPNQGDQRRHANKMGIDPNNPDCAILVTATGPAYECTNGTNPGGATFTAISTSQIPNTGVYNQGAGIGIVAFDPSSGTTGGRTNTVYVASYTNGIYVRTTPAGAFSPMSSAGSPPTFTQITDMVCASDGTLYTLDNGATVHKFSGGTWTNITPPFTGNNIALYFSVDKTNPLHIFVWASAGSAESTDGGINYPKLWDGSSPPILWQSLDVPWLSTTRLAANNTIDIASTPHIDPFNNHVTWFAGNQGMWNMQSNTATGSWGYIFTNSSPYALGTMTITASHFNGGFYAAGDGFIVNVGGQTVRGIIVSITPGSPDTVVVNIVQATGSIAPGSYIVTALVVTTGRVAGIEELVGTTVCRPPNSGFTMLTGWDEGAIRSFNPTIYPTAQSWDTTDQIAQCSQSEYASSDATFMVFAMGAPIVGGGQNDAFSPSGSSGAPGTVTAYSPQPNSAYTGNQTDGSIAASTPTNVVRVYNSADAQLWVTQDNSTWTRPTMAGVPAPPSQNTGWGLGGFFIPTRIVAADRVTSGKFYAANCLSTSGMYESHDSGSTWNLIVPNTGSTQFQKPNVGGQAILKTVPNKAGHFFFTAGLSNPPHPDPNFPLLRCTDGLAGANSLVSVDNGNYQVREVQAIGFGGVAQNQSYPSICIWGYVNALGAGYVLGFWESVDNTATWQQIGGPYPGPGWIDFIIDITGDVNTYGEWWAACGFGSGFLYATR